MINDRINEAGIEFVLFKGNSLQIYLICKNMYLIDSARQETYAGFGFAQLLCVWFSKVKFWT